MTYRRPPLNLEVFVDDNGTPIDYGNRWGMGHPPEDTYSVTAHPERFAPLLDVARALREYLVATYDVDVNGGTMVPRDPKAASLRIAETDYPSVEMLAGAAGEARFPQCGCDACDEGVEDMAEQLERFVFAVVNGRFQEWRKGRRMYVSWDDEHGGSSWEKSTRDSDPTRLNALKARGKGATWAPWPKRD